MFAHFRGDVCVAPIKEIAHLHNENAYETYGTTTKSIDLLMQELAATNMVDNREQDV